MHDSNWSRDQHYSVLPFLNGHLHAVYTKLSGWLELPPCGKSQWQRIIESLEPHVTGLAEWFCKTVGKKKKKKEETKINEWLCLMFSFIKHVDITRTIVLLHGSVIELRKGQDTTGLEHLVELRVTRWKKCL